MLTLKTFVSEKVKLDEIEFRIRALTREEFLTYSKRLTEATPDTNEGNPEEFYALAMEIIETAIVCDDPETKERILEKIANSPIAVQNKLFERIMQLSAQGK